MSGFWKVARRFAIYLACCLTITVIAMIVFPDHVDRIIPAFFLLAFIGLFFTGIPIVNWFMTQSDNAEMAGGKPNSAFKKASMWIFFVVGAFFVLRGSMALAQVISSGSISANLAATVEDGIFGAVSLYCGFRMRKVLRSEVMPDPHGEQGE